MFYFDTEFGAKKNLYSYTEVVRLFMEPVEWF